MQELKFRAWNNAIMKFTYFGTKVSFEHIDNKKPGVFIEATTKIYLGYYENLEQYTGVNDKNGKNIYVGDIVKSPSKKFKGKYFSVKWNNFIGGYTFKPDKNASSWPSFNADTINNLEVVGHIHRNLELLNI